MLAGSFSASDLDGVSVITIYLLFHLYDLAPVNLYNRAWQKLTPSVPEMRAANFVAKEAYSLRTPVDGLSWLNFKLRVNYFIKRSESSALMCNPIFFTNQFLIIDDFGLIEILLPKAMQRTDRQWLAFHPTWFPWNILCKHIF